MVKPKDRVLMSIANIDGVIIAGRCSQCFRPFEVKFTGGESPAVIEAELGALFNAHICDED